MLETLASKHRSTVTKMARKYKATIDTPDGPRKCFEVIVERGGEKKALVPRFGGIPLKRQRTAAMADREPLKPNHNSTTELVKRLLADCCEICGSTSRIEVHHIRRLADLKQQGRAERPVWVKLMAMRRRKTLVVCRPCHEDIHAGRATSSTRKRSLESGVRGNQPAPFGKAVGKGPGPRAPRRRPTSLRRWQRNGTWHQIHPAPAPGRRDGCDHVGPERRLHGLPRTPACGRGQQSGRSAGRSASSSRWPVDARRTAGTSYGRSPSTPTSRCATSPNSSCSGPRRHLASDIRHKLERSMATRATLRPEPG